MGIYSFISLSSGCCYNFVLPWELYSNAFRLSVCLFAFYFLMISNRPQIKCIPFLVPGDGGSQVEAKLNKTSTIHYYCEKTTSDFFNIWLNPKLLVPLVIECWIDNVLVINKKIKFFVFTLFKLT